jgi:hypothetical protein
MFHVCVQVDENDVSLIWISNNNNMRLLLLLYRQVKGSLYLEKRYEYLGEGKVRGRLILFLLWIGSSAWNISRTFVKGEIHDGSAIRVVSTKQVNSSRKQSPSKFVCTGTLVDYGSYYYYTQVYKGQKWKGKNRKSYFSRCELEGN